MGRALLKAVQRQQVQRGGQGDAQVATQDGQQQRNVAAQAQQGVARAMHQQAQGCQAQRPVLRRGKKCQAHCHDPKGHHQHQQHGGDMKVHAADLGWSWGVDGTAKSALLGHG